ncbi:MAG: PepSY-like domain-containing protein [Bryobacteraceae bacterium]
MKTSICASGIFLLLGSVSFAAEQPVNLQQLPPAVRQTAAEQSKGATVRGYTKEVEHGQTRYEVATVKDGKTRDVEMDANGNVTEVEQEVSLDSIPASARTALQKAAASGKITKVESVTSGSKVNYEATIRTGKRHIEIQVDSNGQRQKED